MTTEFHGKPVAGGTFPALIWKALMQKALAKLPPETFTPPDYGYAAPVSVVNRGGELERDDGVCRNTAQLEFFGGEVLDNGGNPARVATCKANEVEIPDTVGMSLASARSRLQGQPLTPQVVYKPARTGQAARSRRRAAAAKGHRVGRRSDHDRPAEVAARSRPEPRRPAAPASRGEARAPQAHGLDHGRHSRQGRQAVTAPSDRVAAGRAHRAHRPGNGRLTNREPARPYRHGRSAALVIPIRVPVTTSTGARRACSENGGSIERAGRRARASPRAPDRAGPARCRAGADH